MLFNFQYLIVHLGQEENDCFSAWVTLKDVVYTDIEQKGVYMYDFA